MAELDSLLDSLILQQRNGPEVPSIDEKYAATLTIKETPPKGQGLFAIKPLSVQTPICSLNYPTMMAIDSDFVHTVCYHCLVLTAIQLPLPSHGITPAALKICNGCHFARFCSKECQVKAWHAYHKYECKIFKKQHSNPPPASLRAVMRMVLLKDRNILPSQEWNQITGLSSHEHVLAAQGRTNLTDMAEGIKHLTESSMSIEMIQKLIFIMRSNAIELPTPIHGGIGIMIDPLVARINHSCEPNVSIHRPQYTTTSGWMSSSHLSEDERETFAQVVPLRDIKEGEELLNSYIVPTVSVNARKRKLMEDYLFTCNCPRCVSDLKAADNLINQQPGLSANYEQWITNVIRHLSRVKREPSAVQKAAAAMYKSERFLEYPSLYTTGDFPQMAMTLIKEGLQARALDEALVNVLRIHFLINPERFVGRHNPTELYTTFLMLDIFDSVLRISTPAGISEDDRERWLLTLASRGMTKSNLRYWRYRLCADLRKRLEEGPPKDLLELVGKREAQMEDLFAEDQKTSADELKVNAEQGMRNLLGLNELRWQTILQNCGC